MSRRVTAVVLGALLALAAGSVWLRAQRNDARPISALLPSGAILYLEAKDLHSLLEQWNSSEERRRWLKSENASVLSQSRLLQRLMQAQDQFATVAGLPVEMNLVNELAGSQSAFAFYEFSTLHFVYLTHLDGARLGQSSLWKSRGSFQTRNLSGIPFYIKTESSGRDSYTVSFASHDGWLVVATEPNLMGRTLALLAAQPAGSVASEPWFADTVKQIPQQGDLRLVYNLALLRKTPQFRTYWIQRNVSEMAEYSAGSADLFQRATGFEERRVLVRSSPMAVVPDGAAMADALSSVPADASLYRTWASPTRTLVKAALQQVMFGEPVDAPDTSKEAPQVFASTDTVGSASDLETRIDEPAFHKSTENKVDEVTDTVMAMQPLALLHSQLTSFTGDRVFVLPESEVALVCSKADRAALDAAIKTSVGIAKTGSLDLLRTSLQNRTLIVSRLPAHASMAVAPPLPGETYAASYQHSAEWPRYKRLFGVVDRGAANAPTFFSGNIRSLGDSLYRLRRASVLTQENGALVRETVRYEFAAK